MDKLVIPLRSGQTKGEGQAGSDTGVAGGLSLGIWLEGEGITPLRSGDAKLNLDFCLCWCFARSVVPKTLR
jgi:hypothetical protein